MYNEDSYDETVNPVFDLYREFRAEDERKSREALGENLRFYKVYIIYLTVYQPYQKRSVIYGSH